MFLILFCDIFKVESGSISHKTEKYFSRRQVSPVFQHGFLRSEENVDLHNLSVSLRENVNLHKFQQSGMTCWGEVNLMQWQML